MRKRIWTVAVGFVAVAAIIAVPSALAAYTSTKLEIQQVGTKLTAKISASPDDDPTALAQVYAPAGTQITANQAPGTVLGTASVHARVLALAGADVELAGQIVVAAPGQVPTSQSAPCLRGATPLATWLMVLSALGQEVAFPLYLVPNSGSAALGPAYVLVCLPAPDTPAAQADPKTSVKLYSATLTISGVFSPVPLGAWISIWTPYTPKTGVPNPAGTLVAPAAVAPGAVTITAKTARSGAVVSGVVTQAGQPRGGATVTVLGGSVRSKLTTRKRAKVAANGRFSVKFATGTFFRADAAATSAAAEPLCTQLQPLIAPTPCVNPTVNGFTAKSKVVKKK